MKWEKVDKFAEIEVAGEKLSVEIAKPHELFNGLSYSGKRTISRTNRKAANMKAVSKRRKARKAARRNKRGH